MAAGSKLVRVKRCRIGSCSRLLVGFVKGMYVFLSGEESRMVVALQMSAIRFGGLCQ